MMMMKRRRRIFFYFKVFRGSIDLSHPSCWVALSSATSMMLLLVSWYKNYPVMEGAGMTFPRTTGACHCNDTRAGLGREMTPGGDFPESWISQIPPGQHTGGLSMPTMRQTHLYISVLLLFLFSCSPRLLVRKITFCFGWDWEAQIACWIRLWLHS